MAKSLERKPRIAEFRLELAKSRHTLPHPQHFSGLYLVRARNQSCEFLCILRISSPPFCLRNATQRRAGPIISFDFGGRKLDNQRHVVSNVEAVFGMCCGVVWCEVVWDGIASIPCLVRGVVLKSHHVWYAVWFYNHIMFGL